jgi:hypothetical protein
MKLKNFWRRCHKTRIATSHALKTLILAAAAAIVLTGADYVSLGGPAGLTWFFKSVYVPQIYGATANGTTNDATAIQAAINAAAAGGNNSTVYLSDGAVYAFSTTLDASFTGIQIKGKGTLKWTGATGGSTNCIQLKKLGSTNASYAWNVHLEDFTLDTGGAFAGIYIQGVHHNVIRNIAITNSHASAVTTHAMQMKFSVLGTVDNLRITQNEAAFGSAAGITNGVTLDTDGINGPSTAYTFINPIIEGVTGNGLNFVNCSYINIQGGSSENSTSFGIVSGNRTGISIGSASFSNTFTGVDLEANSVDLDISGRNNTFTSITSSDVVNVNSSAKANTFVGGRYNSISVNTSATSTSFLNLSYGYQGGTVTDTSPSSLWANVDNDSFGINGTATLGFGGPANGNAGFYSNGGYTVLNSKGANPLYLNFDNANAAATIDMFHGNVVVTKAGRITPAAGINIPSGGSTTIGAGVGSVRMSTGNAATNTVWIPMQYAGTTYYVPAFTTNAP